MAKYQIDIKETLERVIEVEAEDEDAAIEKAWEMYNDGEVVLDATDHTATEVFIW